MVDADVDTRRRKNAVRNLINTLSFSELEAAVAVMEELSGEGVEAVAVRGVDVVDGNLRKRGAGEKKTGMPEGLLIAGRIADRLGFTRSVVTASLKKLEGAGLIETRSLGMKGTYIRVKDAMLVEELGKL